MSANKTRVGSVSQLWQYPVKSMAGNQLETSQIEKFGMVGDRGWAVRDETAGEITTVRRIPKLMHCQVEYDGTPAVGNIPAISLILPNGTKCHSDNLNHANQALSDYLGKPVSLWPLKPKTDFKHYQLNTVHGAKSLKKMFAATELPDYSSVSWSKLVELAIFATPLGRYYDIHPLHVLTSNSLDKLSEIEPAGDFCVQRFRPNIYIESASNIPAFDEFEWLSGQLYIGSAIIKCEVRTVRCSMPAQPQQPFDLTKDSKVLRTIEKHTGRHVGIYATVVQAGHVSVGDSVYWQPAKPSVLRDVVTEVSGRVRNRYIHTLLNAVDKIADAQKRFRN